MSSPLHSWFQVANEAASSPPSLHSSSSQPQRRGEGSSFTLHHLLQTSQRPVAERMFHHILWDVRENPLKAQYVKNLGTELSLKALNEFATTPALHFLKIVCEFPSPWECFVSIEKKQSGASGTINAPRLYPPATPTSSLVYCHSSSVSLPQTSSSFTSPPRPQMPFAPLPPINPLLLISVPANVITIAPLRAQNRESREIGITVGDLLHAIYKHLNHLDVSIAELESLSDKQRRLVQEAYDKRRRVSLTPVASVDSSLLSLSSTSAVTVSLAPSISNVAIGAIPSGPLAQGMKQVDKLMRHTWFAGLTVVPTEGNTIRLTLKMPIATN